MKRSASLFACALLLAILAAGVYMTRQRTTPAKPSEGSEVQGAFEWFGTLGYPDVRDRKFVKVTTSYSMSINGKDTDNSNDTYGFVLSEDSDKIIIFTPSLATVTFQKEPPDTGLGEKVKWETADLPAFASQSFQQQVGKRGRGFANDETRMGASFQ